MIDQNALLQFADDLRQLAEQVQNATVESTHTVSISFADVLSGYPSLSLAEVQQWVSAAQAGSQYIYQFSVDDSVSSEGLLKGFNSAKAEKKNNRAYARSHKASSLLYVGSSGSLMARLKQHLGYGPKGTYAMQLCHWLPSDHGRLKIEIWRFSVSLKKSVIQAIEDGYWSHRQPMLGRQGMR